jgi:hypothetical protein
MMKLCQAARNQHNHIGVTRICISLSALHTFLHTLALIEKGNWPIKNERAYLHISGSARGPNFNAICVTQDFCEAAAL